MGTSWCIGYVTGAAVAVVVSAFSFMAGLAVGTIHWLRGED